MSPENFLNQLSEEICIENDEGDENLIIYIAQYYDSIAEKIIVILNDLEVPASTPKIVFDKLLKNLADYYANKILDGDASIENSHGKDSAIAKILTAIGMHNGFTENMRNTEKKQLYTNLNLIFSACSDPIAKQFISSFIALHGFEEEIEEYNLEDDALEITIASETPALPLISQLYGSLYARRQPSCVSIAQSFRNTQPLKQ